MSQYTFRVRAAKGLESTLIKDLRWQLKLNKKEAASMIRKIPGRKTIEVKGPMSLLWQLLISSRIAEDIQLKASQPFVARGEKELKTALTRVNWHCYMPTGAEHREFEIP